MIPVVMGLVGAALGSAFVLGLWWVISYPPRIAFVLLGGVAVAIVWVFTLEFYRGGKELVARSRLPRQDFVLRQRPRRKKDLLRHRPLR